MPYLSEIDLANVTVFSCVAQAPVGALLQVIRDGAITVGMHVKPFASDVSAFLPLEGPDVGQLIHKEGVAIGPAIDISAIATIAIKDAAPKHCGYAPPNVGHVIAVPGPNGVRIIGMAVGVASDHRLVGCALLTGSERGTTTPIDDAVDLGHAVVLPIKGY